MSKFVYRELPPACPAITYTHWTRVPYVCWVHGCGAPLTAAQRADTLGLCDNCLEQLREETRDG